MTDTTVSATRTAPGLASTKDRRRWTTALDVPALDRLHDLAKDTGLNRCEVVERLLLNDEAVAAMIMELANERAAAKKQEG